MNFKKFFIFMSSYGFFIILIGTLVAVIFIIRQNQISVQKYKIELETKIAEINEQIENLESGMQEQFTLQTELLLEAGQAIGASTVAAIVDEIAAGTASTRSRINLANDRIQLTNERIQQIDSVYSDMLAEMEKRTLDSLYNEAVLVDMEEEAAALFRAGRYVQAGGLYKTIAENQPENNNARFFYFYSLFLSNRMNRSNYPQIKEGLQTLQRNGYQRPEIREVLEFIEQEEKGLKSGGMQ